MARAVVVGAGLAGLRAAQGLRRAGFERELVVVGDEPHGPYNRPPLSKEVLAGEQTPEACLLPTGDLEATWLLGRSATALDARTRVLTLDGGDALAYDELVVATGCRPRPWPDAATPAGVHVLRTLDEAVGLRNAVRGCRHVTVVGAGFLGCEAAATLRERGLDVALVDVAPHPMPALGREIGERAARLHRAHEVDLRLRTFVAAVEGRDRVEAVRLSDGTRIETDLILAALGALPNTAWLAGSGLALHAGGVVCDAHGLAVGTDHVAAAGDVAAWPHPAAGGMIRVEHWANAAEMGLRVAANLLAAPGDRRPHAPVLTFWSHQYNVKIQAAGLLSGASARQVVREEPDAGLLVVEGRSAGRLVAGVTFNSASDHLRHRREIAQAA